MLSNKTKYALKALIALAKSQPGQPVQISTLATQEKIPQKFLELILLEMKHLGVLESRRGKDGGYLLNAHPSTIMIGDVIRFLEGPLALLPCASTSRYKKCDDCVDEAACGLRRLMKEVRDTTAQLLDQTSLADIISPQELNFHI